MRPPLLFLHIAGGMVGLLSGTVAMVYRKGSRGHRAAGNVFVVAMLIMGACGSTLALMKHQTNNVFGGLLTVYMISTAWLAGRRRDGETSIFDWGALVFGLAIGASLLTLGMLVANDQPARQAGVPLGMYFFMGTIPLLAAAGDIRMLVRGGISGTPRIARHLWRMCFGLFIASGSFFLTAASLPACHPQAVHPGAPRDSSAGLADLLARARADQKARAQHGCSSMANRSKRLSWLCMRIPIVRNSRSLQYPHPFIRLHP